MERNRFLGWWVVGVLIEFAALALLSGVAEGAIPTVLAWPGVLLTMMLGLPRSWTIILGVVLGGAQLPVLIWLFSRRKRA